MAEGSQLTLAEYRRVIRWAMDARGQTSEDVAEQVGKDVSTVNRWLRGQNDIPLGDFIIIMRMAGFTLQVIKPICVRSK